jgi:hypothetical protein
MPSHEDFPGVGEHRRMKSFVLAWGALLMLPAPAAQAATKSRAIAVPPPASERPPAPLSAEARRVADWVAAAGDNHGLPYAIIDKKAATLFLYRGSGARVGDAPVLLGVAIGDDATPGVGAKSLAEVGPAERTTPAGRFLAKFGIAAGRQRVLWVDYATSVALHTIPPGNPKEKRRERMLSPTPADNRITFGCINVPIAFYGRRISPLFRKKGGYVYILPDVKPLEAVFPPLHARPATGR